MNGVEEAEFGKRLGNQSYQAIGAELAVLSSEKLVSLLSSRYRRVGDMAASQLSNRKESGLIIDALKGDQIHTVSGRIRATNILNWLGRAAPEATNALIHCLDDRSDDVVGNALFGIVFMRRLDLVPLLKKYLTSLRFSKRREASFRAAITALEVDNPLLFSPGYQDTQNIWRLNEPSSQP